MFPACEGHIVVHCGDRQVHAAACPAGAATHQVAHYTIGELDGHDAGGEVYAVAREEGLVNDPQTLERVGTYYKQLGTVRIASGGKDSAVGLVLMSCQPIIKGDFLVPFEPKPPVDFSGQLSNHLTPLVDGLSSHIILAEDDLREMSSGDICYIAAGSRDGVKAGDRFTIYRHQPPFDPLDLLVAGKQGNASYRKILGNAHSGMITEKLGARSLPPKVVGDIVVWEVGETTATARIVNSLSEIHLGDLVIRR